MEEELIAYEVKIKTPFEDFLIEVSDTYDKFEGHFEDLSRIVTGEQYDIHFRHGENSIFLGGEIIKNSTFSIKII